MTHHTINTALRGQESGELSHPITPHYLQTVTPNPSSSMAHQCHAPPVKRQRANGDARAFEEGPFEERQMPNTNTEAGNLLGRRCDNISEKIQLSPTDVNTLRHIHPPQEEVAKQVTRVIRDEPKVLFQIVCALTQSGKTGAMVSITEKALQTHCIDPDCIYTITGVNAKEWKQQTKHRQLSPFQKRVLHRGELYPPRETNSRRRTKASKKRRRTMNKFAELQNALVIIDEAHVAAAEGMTLDKLLDIICAKNLTELCRRNINIVLFTATPNLLQQEVQTQQWPCGTPCYRMHIMRQGEGYTSIFDLLESGRVSEYENLAAADTKDSDDENESVAGADEGNDSTPVQRLKTFICSRYTQPRIHIIRTPYQEKQGTVVHRVFAKPLVKDASTMCWTPRPADAVTVAAGCTKSACVS